MSHTFKILISNWSRTRKFIRLLYAGKAIAFGFSHNSHALITLYIQFSSSDWWKFDWVLCHLVMFLTTFFLLDVSSEIEPLTRLFCVIHGWFVYCAFGWEMHRLSKSLEIWFRIAWFSKMSLLTCPFLRRTRRVEKSQGILAWLDDVQEQSLDWQAWAFIRAIYTRKNKTRTVPFIRACLI